MDIVIIYRINIAAFFMTRLVFLLYYCSNTVVPQVAEGKTNIKQLLRCQVHDIEICQGLGLLSTKAERAFCLRFWRYRIFARCLENERPRLGLVTKPEHFDQSGARIDFEYIININIIKFALFNLLTENYWLTFVVLNILNKCNSHTKHSFTVPTYLTRLSYRYRIVI